MEGINEKYKISYGFQYDAWELEICHPDTEEFASKEEAEREIENRMVSALLTADAIFVFYGSSLLKILADDTENYRFSCLNEKVYDRLGPPLSPDDIDRLIEKDMLEEILFSSRYIVTEDDYNEFRGKLTDVYGKLKERKEPAEHLPPRFHSGRICGYLFESIWYQAEVVKEAWHGS